MSSPSKAKAAAPLEGEASRPQKKARTAPAGVDEGACARLACMWGSGGGGLRTPVAQDPNTCAAVPCPLLASRTHSCASPRFGTAVPHARSRTCCADEVKTNAPAGVVLESLDLEADTITLRNTGATAVSLKGWKLVSKTGSQVRHHGTAGPRLTTPSWIVTRVSHT